MRIATTLLLSLFIMGCGTVTPNHVTDHYASSDPSKPPQYQKGWLLRDDFPDHSAWISEDARTRYNNLIADYRLQYRRVKGLDISPGDGLTAIEDSWKNHIWRIDAAHLETFKLLSKWLKEHRPTDSVGSKLLDKVTP